MMSSRELKAGDKVMIREGCHYMSQSEGTIGTIIQVYGPPDEEYRYRVRWANKHENSYGDSHIKSAIASNKEAKYLLLCSKM